MAKILNGKKIAQKILEDLEKKIKKSHLKLVLGVVLIGQSQVSKIYINQKRKACQKIGVDFKLFKFSSRINTMRLKKEVKKILPSVSGLIIQLPLPQNIKAQEILNIIPPEKDVDCLSEKNLGRFYTGDLSILPPIVGGVSCLFKEYKIKIKGKNVVIIGVGRLTGKPLTLWFLQKKATVSVLNEFTKDTPFFTKNADILVSGVGKPNLITGKILKKGVIVIDAGTSYKKGKLVGDVDFESVSKKASYLTPVPGGVGPLTVACLLENLVKLK